MMADCRSVVDCIYYSFELDYNDNVTTKGVGIDKVPTLYIHNKDSFKFIFDVI